MWFHKTNRQLFLYLLFFFSWLKVCFLPAGGCGWREDDPCGKSASSFAYRLRARDWEKLEEYVNDKRTCTVSEEEKNLIFTADLRLYFFLQREKKHEDYASSKKFCCPDKTFFVGGNFYVDYITEKTWAITQIHLDNSAGIAYKSCGKKGERDFSGSGCSSDICLMKAYAGCNVICCDEWRFDVEAGRRNLYQIFDSEVQFLSRFDGVLFKYFRHFEDILQFYFYLGGFVVNQTSNHFGWAAELGALNLFESGAEIKYSYIDWGKEKKCFGPRHSRQTLHFQISQITFHYRLDENWLALPSEFYAAFLFNHAAGKSICCTYPQAEKTISGHKRTAAYIGFRTGSVEKAGDWAIDLQYQYVEAQAVPNGDVSGIGRGSCEENCLPALCRSNANYQGWRIEGLYAVTDHLAIDARVEASREIHRSIGGKHRFAQFLLESIYAF